MVLRYDAEGHKAVICASWAQILSGRGQAGTAAAVKWRCSLTGAVAVSLFRQAG